MLQLKEVLIGTDVIEMCSGERERRSAREKE